MSDPIDPAVQALAEGGVPEAVLSPKGGGGRLRQVLQAGIGTALGSAPGLFLPFILAHRVGVGHATDVYFIVVGSVQLVYTLMMIVAESSALPVIATVTVDDPNQARGAVWSVVRSLLPYAAIGDLAALVALALTVLPASGVNVLHDHTAMIFLLSGLPMGVIATASGVAAGANFAMANYTFTTASDALRMGTAFIAIFLVPPRFGLETAVIAFVCGEVLRFFALLLHLPGSARQGSPAHLRLGPQVLALALPAMVSSVVIGVNPLIDKAVAAHVAVGAATVLELAEKVYYVPSVLLVTAISKVAASHWARMGLDEAKELTRDFRRVQVVAVGAGLAAALALAGIVWVAMREVPWMAHQFEGGGAHFFTVLSVFLMGLPFALSSDLSNAMIGILREVRVLPWIAAGLVLVNLVGDLVGAYVFGTAGIALASTGVRVAACLVNVVVVWWLLGRARARVDAAGLQDL